MKITKFVTYETYAYSTFKKIQGNRTISERNVKGIVRNIKENGLKPTIVIVNEKMEIIDGQHRVEAFKRLGLPVYYQVHKGLKLEDCIAMNTNAITWGTQDYIESYAETGNKEYIELKRLAEKYPEFTPTNIVCILNNVTTGKVGKMIKFETLELKLKGKEAETRLNYISNLYKHINNLSGRKESLLTVLARVADLTCIDKERLQESVEKYGYLMTEVVDIKNCLAKLEEIYNYRRVNKVRFISKYFEVYEDTFNPCRRG